MIKHIVGWNFADEAEGRSKNDNIAEVKRRLDALPALMEGLLAFEVTAAQPELEASFDLLLYSEFTDVDVLQAYATHPEHVAVAQLIGAVRSGRAAFDYDPEGLLP